jgi:hypothetical protein
MVAIILYLGGGVSRRYLGIVPVWIAMVSLHAASVLMPAAFFIGFGKRLRSLGRPLTWGLLAVLMLGCLYYVIKGFLAIQIGLLPIYDFVVHRGFLSFLILAFLGFAASREASDERSAVMQFFFVAAGWLFWAPSTGMTDALGITFILLAGPGLEALKNEIMDDSWHGRAVWAFVGVLLAWGLFKGSWNLYNGPVV